MNKKGFALSSMIYTLLVICLALMLGILASLASQKFQFDKIGEIIHENLNSIIKTEEGSEFVFDYTGDYQTFVAPTDGYYNFEAWGAQGGNDIDTKNGGYGSYTSGDIYLTEGEIIYVYVGGQGSLSAVAGDENSKGYNGGGAGGYMNPADHVAEAGGAGGGGGATDFRLNDSTNSIIMIAGGGGGQSNYYTQKPGGSAGGLIGYAGVEDRNSGSAAFTNAQGATQTTGGQAAIGSSSYTQPTSGIFSQGGSSLDKWGGGGGGGYYGGGASSATSGVVGSGAGGSSYISGHTGSVAITSESDTTPTTTDLDFSIRYIEIGSSGSNSNTNNHIVELQAFTADGTNVASGKSVTSNKTQNSSYPFSRVTDGNTTSAYFADVGSITTVDLGAEYNLESVKLWRYYTDSRTYYNTYVKVYNEDFSRSTYLHISTLDGTYAETSAGKTLSTKICETGTLNNNCSIHYSDKYFTNTVMIDGSGYNWTNKKEGIINMPTIDNGTYETNIGHSGNGSAKITYLGTTLDEETIETGQVFDFAHISDYQTFIVPESGNYKFEAWGASSTNQGNTYILSNKTYAGYTSGNIHLEKDQIIYVYVGGMGEKFNTSTTVTGLSKSGGATDFRLIQGEWNEKYSLNSRIMVAGGSGGTYADGSGGVGGDAGGLTSQGALISYTTAGASQTFGGSAGLNSYAGGFGYGGYSAVSAYNSGAGGYYGGGSSPSGGGGSSFISGHTGAVAITSVSNSSPKTGCTTGTTTNECSKHYSTLTFTNTVMIDGSGYNWTNVRGSLTPMPNPNGGSYSNGLGHSGAGHARITYLGN